MEMRLLKIIAIALLTGMVGATGVSAREPASSNALNLPGNLIFGAGGLSGRFLVFDDWVSTRNYTLNDVIKHSGALWVALADPGAGDEPGVDADWEKITDQVAANPGGTPALTLSTMTIGMFDYTVSGGGTGATTFVALTDTPSSITANMCVLGNGAGNALIFGACGGAGDGDIEGVTAGIGLSGGGTTGTVTLNLDLTSGVGAVTDLQDGDDFVLADDEQQRRHPPRHLLGAEQRGTRRDHGRRSAGEHHAGHRGGRRVRCGELLQRHPRPGIRPLRYGNQRDPSRLP